MKKLILTGVLTIATAFCSYAEADIEYSFNDADLTCSVHKATNVSGDVEIPSAVEYNGKQYQVTSIGEFAFYECSALTSITIPENVTSLGDGAFYECSALTSITIPENVTSIGDYAFRGCSALTSVTIPENVTSIGSQAFYDCVSLTSITIPENVTSIGSQAFYDCVSLTSVTIPENVTSIGHRAFSGCSALTSVTIPENVTSIGSEAFYDCVSLTSITIPENVTSIGDQAFYNCSALTSVTIPENVTSIGREAFCGCNLDNIFYNATNATCGSNVLGKFKKLVLGPNVKYAPQKDSFYYYYDQITLEFSQGIESIYIPTNTKEIILHLNDIDDWAINAPEGYSPYRMSDEDYYENYTYINFSISEVNADFNGRPIKNITLGSKVNKIAANAFAGFRELQSVAFPEYLTEIGEGAFCGSTITSAMLPETVSTIGDFAFAECEMLREVKLPAELASLEKGAFYDCTALYSIKLPDNMTELPDYVFQGCTDLETIEFPKNLVSIGNNVCLGCTKLTAIEFPDCLQTIGDYAFYYTPLSGELKFGNALLSIGSKSFARGRSHVVKLPEGIQSIGDDVFSESPLREINLPESLNYIGAGAFSNTYLSSIVIPNSITEIKSRTFKECTNLTTVTLPNTLESIGENAFYYNRSLIEINLPESLKTIGSRAFYDSDLVNCVIPDNVIEIGEHAFSAVKYMTIGKGMEAMSDPIAYRIDVLEMKSSTPPALGTERLGFSPKIVIVPEGAGESYTANNRWKDYNISARNSRRASIYISEPGTLATECRIQTGYLPAQITNLIVEGTLNDDDFAVMRSNMTACYSIDLAKLTNTSLPKGVLKGKDTLLQLTLPEGLEEIGVSAFEDCSVMHLTSLPSSLKEIGEKAFYNCQSMDNDLVFPSALENIGWDAFAECYSLKGVDFSACPDAKFSANYYGSRTFYNCKNLAKAILPENLTEIPASMFEKSAIQAFVLPSSITSIGESAFSWTKSLRTVAFSESLNEIGKNAFAFSGIESADLPKSVESIGVNAFGGSSIAYADIKDGVKELPTDVFNGCNMLFAVNLPSTLNSLGANAISSSSIAAITSASELPAATADGSPFTGVDNYNCALTIPKPSYSKYLSAEYWGAFVDIRNWIDVTMPETDIDVTYIDENDYQEMLEDEADESNTPSTARRRALGVMRRDGKISTSRGYGKLFNGASLFAADKSQTRIFINVPESFTDLKVVYNGTDITSQIDRETMSFVTPELTAVSSLKISGYDPEGNISAITTNDDSAPVYTLTGMVAAYGKQSLSKLPSGIYIFNGKKIVVK